MCRIFFNPSKTTSFTTLSLDDFFIRLEKSGGGDGNGIFSFERNVLLRSISYMPWLDEPKGMLIFHTRKATNGLVRDYNCQPFVGDRYIVAHNGVFSAVENYAKILGYPHPSEKYSDSYVMAWIIEKVGILNFYTAFEDKGYGVILAYDKELKQMFLLKTSGSFTWAKLKSNGKNLYCTEKLDYWQIEDEPKSFDSGLYRLNDTDFITMYKPLPVIHYNSKHNKYYNTQRWWEEKKAGDICDYCGDWFATGDERFNDDSYIICKSCHIRYVDKKKEVPKACLGCNWLERGACWFGGLKREKFAIITNIDKSKTICNTKDDILDIIAGCDICGKELKNKDFWGIRDGTIICIKCRKRIDEINKLNRIKRDGIKECCDTCHFHGGGMDMEPCLSCINSETGEYEHWAKMNGLIPDSDIDCDNCKYLEYAQEEEPCSICCNNKKYYSEWKERLPDAEQEIFELEHKNSTYKKRALEYKKIVDDSNGKCYHCGYHFYEDEELICDKKGHRICYDCTLYDEEGLLQE